MVPPSRIFQLQSGDTANFFGMGAMMQALVLMVFHLLPATAFLQACASRNPRQITSSANLFMRMHDMQLVPVSHTKQSLWQVPL